MLGKAPTPVHPPYRRRASIKPLTLAFAVILLMLQLVGCTVQTQPLTAQRSTAVVSATVRATETTAPTPTATPSPTSTATLTHSPTPLPPTETPEPTATAEPTATVASTKEVSREEQIRNYVEKKLRMNGFSPEERRKLQDLIIEYLPQIKPVTIEEIKQKLPWIENPEKYAEYLDPFAAMKNVWVVRNAVGQGFSGGSEPGGVYRTYAKYDKNFVSTSYVKNDGFALSVGEQGKVSLLALYKEFLSASIFPTLLKTEGPNLNLAVKSMDVETYAIYALTMVGNSGGKGEMLRLGNSLINDANKWATKEGIR